MNIDNFAENSESSDEDYVPEGGNVELPSEEESDGVAEDTVEDVDTRSNKRNKKVVKSKKRLKKSTEGEEVDTKIDEQKKEQTNSLWADFIKDTGFKTRAERSQAPTNNAEVADTKPEKEVAAKEKTEKTVKITEVYEFAGEEVKIEKEVKVDSSDARSSSSDSLPRKTNNVRMNSILNSFGKKRKINTLEKSKLDWERFKKDEKIEDELHAYGKSKDGYLEKQDFLQRADLRRFEIEKGIRNSLRKNRMNSSGNM